MSWGSNLPAVKPDREPMTEMEAMLVGDSAYRLAKLRRMLREAETVGGTLTVGSATQWVSPPSIRLGNNDLQAVLALLIEREELFLASFNVSVERP